MAAAPRSHTWGTLLNVCDFSAGQLDNQVSGGMLSHTRQVDPNLYVLGTHAITIRHRPGAQHPGKWTANNSTTRGILDLDFGLDWILN